MTGGSLTGRIAGALVALFVLIALSAPWLPVADPAATNLDARLLPPLSPGHLLGTDQLGRDVLARSIFAIRASLAVALAGVTSACAVGCFVGALAGLDARHLDSVVMRATDVLMAFPYLLLALAIVAALGPSLLHATLAIAIVNVPFFARLIRGKLLVIRGEQYIEAARAAGASELRVLVRHVLPNLLPVMLVAASSSMGWMIVETAGLSFLGLGAQPPQADLGALLGRARHLAVVAPHVVIAPGCATVILVLAFNLWGDHLRDRLDPRLAALTPAGSGSP